MNVKICGYTRLRDSTIQVTEKKMSEIHYCHNVPSPQMIALLCKEKALEAPVQNEYKKNYLWFYLNPNVSGRRQDGLFYAFDRADVTCPRCLEHLNTKGNSDNDKI